MAILAARLVAKSTDNESLFRMNAELAHTNVQLQNQIDELERVAGAMRTTSRQASEISIDVEFHAQPNTASNASSVFSYSSRAVAEAITAHEPKEKAKQAVKKPKASEKKLRKIREEPVDIRSATSDSAIDVEISMTAADNEFTAESTITEATAMPPTEAIHHHIVAEEVPSPMEEAMPEPTATTKAGVDEWGWGEDADDADWNGGHETATGSDRAEHMAVKVENSAVHPSAKEEDAKVSSDRDMNAIEIEEAEEGEVGWDEW